jgi:hypothetical protein
MWKDGESLTTACHDACPQTSSQRSHLFVERSAPKRVLCLAALYLRSGIGLSGLVEIPVGQNAQGPTALSSRMHRHRHYLHVIGWKGSKIHR